jgi:hypothetical protein
MSIFCAELGVYSKHVDELTNILKAYDIGFKARHYPIHSDIFNDNLGTADMTWFSVRVYTRREYEQLLDALEESDMHIAIQY